MINGEGDGGAESTNSLALAVVIIACEDTSEAITTAINGHQSCVQFGKMSKKIWVAEILPDIKDKVGQHNAAPVVFSWRNFWRFKSAAEDQSPGDKKM